MKGRERRRASGEVSAEATFFFPVHLDFILSSKRHDASSPTSPSASHSLPSAAMAPRQGQQTMDAYGTARRRASRAPTSKIAGDAAAAAAAAAAALVGKVRRSAFRLLVRSDSVLRFFDLAMASRQSLSLMEIRRSSRRELSPTAMGTLADFDVTV